MVCAKVEIKTSKLKQELMPSLHLATRWRLRIQFLVSALVLMSLSIFSTAEEEMHDSLGRGKDPSFKLLLWT
jgi:hypothetical protein